MELPWKITLPEFCPVKLNSITFFSFFSPDESGWLDSLRPLRIFSSDLEFRIFGVSKISSQITTNKPLPLDENRTLNQKSQSYLIQLRGFKHSVPVVFKEDRLPVFPLVLAMLWRTQTPDTWEKQSCAKGMTTTDFSFISYCSILDRMLIVWIQKVSNQFRLKE